MHPDQVPIATQTVRRLVAEQLPIWAGRPIEPCASEGTVNAIFRIGSSLAARFRMRRSDPEALRASLAAESAAARELAEHTSVPVPQVVAIGEPGAGFPLPWSVQTWLPGRSATQEDVGRSTPFAHDLAAFLRDVRSIDRRERSFSGTGRGGKLRDHDEWVVTCFERSRSLLDVVSLRRLWRRYRELPRHPGETMTHGDLVPGNVLVSDGRLAGVLDVGTYGSADPALDLVSAWHLLEVEPRAVLRTALSCSELEWERGKAWAFVQAMGLVWYYERSNPPMSRLGRRTLDRLSAAETT